MERSGRGDTRISFGIAWGLLSGAGRRGDVLGGGVVLRDVPRPRIFRDITPAFLGTRAVTRQGRGLLREVDRRGFRTLVVCTSGRRTDGFRCLANFVPHFRRNLLIIRGPRGFALVLKGRGLGLYTRTHIPTSLVRCPRFSLPGRPVRGRGALRSVFLSLNVTGGGQINIVN